MASRKTYKLFPGWLGAKGEIAGKEEVADEANQITRDISDIGSGTKQ